MANSPITTVTIGQIINEDTGAVCTNPIIKLVGYPNVYINCVDDAKGVYEIELPDNEEIKCLQFEADCNEDGDCAGCNVQFIEKCFCDDKGDCRDCQDCDDEGFCIDLCELCVDNVCQDCIDDEDCPCNKRCDGNGNCICPDGYFQDPDNEDCCIQCNDDNPCDACNICNSSNVCEPLSCPDGICDPDGDECVDCITSDQCEGDNMCCTDDNECECCSGFVWDACEEECVAIPINSCANPEDCDNCDDCTSYDPCTGLGTCSPRNCPTGYIAAEVDGVCQCIEECDCANPDCSQDTSYCKAFGSDCGCVPCDGDCENGCVDPCYCNPNSNECEGSPCPNTPCTSGLECGDDCGCNETTGFCEPCDAASCSGNECDKLLGCECQNESCVGSDGCNDTPCSIAEDCADGCTCVGGICEPCDNFSCITSDCADQPNCGCTGGGCGGVDDPCADVLSISKDDANCEITGTLTKNNCCQCAALTLDVQVKANGETDGAYINDFIVEVRKGQWDGVNVNSVPRVDDFANSSIAENEPPVAGTVRMSVTVYRDDYDVSGGGNIFIGTSTIPLSGTPSTATYPVSGDTAELLFLTNYLPKIGSETLLGNTNSVVTRVDVEFELINQLEFPSGCDYDAGNIAVYSIKDNTTYLNFPSVYGSGKATVFQSEDCRLPFFQWTKSQDTTFNEEPFRKIYAPLVSGTTYADTYGGSEGLESCFNYILESDCNCGNAVSQYVTICNPENLDFTLSDCNHDFVINSFPQCDVNDDVTFRVVAGTINITFTGVTAPIGTPYSSDTSITEVIFSIICDDEGQCTKTYAVGSSDLEITPVTECQTGNGTFIITFPLVDDSGICTVQSVEIGGFILAGSLSKELTVGTYEAIINWDCGCDPTVMTITEDCCDFTLSEISRDCNGVVTCTEDPNVTYSAVINDLPSLLPDVCDYVESYPLNQSLTIRAQKGNCPAVDIILPPLEDICCDNYDLLVNEITESLTIITVNGGGGNPVVTAVNNTSGLPVTVVDNGNNTYNITGYVSGDSITVTAVDEVCGEGEVTFTADGCDFTVELQQFEEDSLCRLRAVADNMACACRYGTYNITIDGVTVINGGDDIKIDFTGGIVGFDADEVTGALHAGEFGSTVNQGFLEGSDSIIIPLTTVGGPSECFSTQLHMTLLDDPDQQNFLTVELEILQGALHLIDNINVASVSVEVNGQAAPMNANNIYVAQNCCLDSSSITIEITVFDTDGNEYFATYSYANARIGLNLASLNICQVAEVPLDSVQAQFSVKDVVLEDSCEYGDVSQVFTVYTNGSVVPNSPQALSLIPVVVDARDVKFTWFRNGIIVFEDFKGALESFTSELPIAETLVGDDYIVSASCGPCSDDDFAQLCCLPEIIVESITDCNQGMNITANGNAGSYEIFYDSVAYGFVITGSGTVNFDVTVVLFEETGLVRLASTPTCNESFDITLVDACKHNMTTACTGNGEYTITIEGCAGAVLSILNGAAGTVVGQTIEDVLEVDPPRIQIEDTNGCIIVIDEGDTLPIGGSCIVTPSYAPTYSPVITPVYAPTYTPVYAPTPYTPTYAPAYAPAPYVPTYAPTYAPTAYVPTYAPTYAPFVYTPGYTPTVYVPTYSPTYVPTPYTPTYSPVYTPTYAPTYAPTPYVPTYAPTPYVPTYAPTYSPVYSPTYAPTYAPTYTPFYVPTYVPSIGPLGACCDGDVPGCDITSEPNCSGTWFEAQNCIEGGPCVTPTYSPTYAPTPFVPTYVPTAGCIGCTAEGGVCCNEIASEIICNENSLVCFWDSSFCDCIDDITPFYAPTYIPFSPEGA